MTTARPNWFK